MLFFVEIIQLLVEETNRYHHQHLDTLDKGQSPLPDVNVQEMCLFLAIISVTIKINLTRQVKSRTDCGK
jgi:hypothetical protein